MKRIKIPWGAWYQDQDLELTIPESWETEVFDFKKRPALSEAEMKAIIQNPTGAPPLAELTRGKNKAAIIVDDISRPAKTAPLIRIVLQELTKEGYTAENIAFFIASGAHRRPTRFDLEKKLGREILDNYRIICHDIYDGLTYFGKSSRGTPIHINAELLNYDFKIGIGGIIPHAGAGFSGGGKIIMPGICGIDSLEANHRLVMQGITSSINSQCNENRLDIEEVAEKVGLNFIVNAVIGHYRETVGVVAGHPVAAHREGTRMALEYYSIPPLSGMAQIGIFNAYPKDTELVHAGNALNVMIAMSEELVLPGGSIVITAACTEGAGYHGLVGVNRRLSFRMEDKAHFKKLFQKGVEIYLYCPNVNRYDVESFSGKIVHYRHWDLLMNKLAEKHGSSSRVFVFPHGSIQIPNGRRVQ
ncbi:MAG: DUF2088 domain-containing protein [Firmicutes bacterium]|nr:DUF2088 domain-containing protein [Bacillota bacterium]